MIPEPVATEITVAVLETPLREPPLNNSVKSTSTAWSLHRLHPKELHQESPLDQHGQRSNRVYLAKIELDTV